MTDSLKEIIESAKPYDGQELYKLYLIDSKEEYNGFYGPNGYNNIIVIGVSRKKKEDEDEYYFLTNWSDVVRVTDIKACNVEIPKDLGCISLYFDETISPMTRSILSTCMLEGAGGGKNDR